jgi:melanoma-associated antigen
MISFTPQSTEKPQNVDAYLTHLIRQGYLDRQRAGDIKGAGAKRARSRAIVTTQGDGGEEIGTWEWRWGNRSQSEVGEKGVAKFIAEFMVERLGGDDLDEDEDEGAGPSRKGKRKGKGKQTVNAEKRMENMLIGIERAAGGNLAEMQS